MDLRTQRFNQAAVAASILVDPDHQGLTRAELEAVGVVHGLKRGQIGDALAVGQLLAEDFSPERRIRGESAVYMLMLMHGLSLPSMPPATTVDRILDEFEAQAAEVGWQQARIAASTVIGRVRAQGTDEHQAKVALALLVGQRTLEVRGGALALRGPVMAGRQRFVAVAERAPCNSFLERLEEVLPTVRDVMSRRGGEQPSHSDPLRAFHERLESLGYPNVQPWWARLSDELSRADEQLSTVTCIVLSAALGEAALTCVALRAESGGLTMTKHLTSEPRQWKFETLIRAAKTGREPLLDGGLGERCNRLNEMRQRIHVARFLDASPAEVDYRPEDARESKETLQRLVRAVLDWLGRHELA